MRPENLKTKIFLDGGDPEETKETLRLLGFLDGQTTNPTLIAKNPEAADRIKRGLKFSKGEVIDFYRDVVKRISNIIPEGSVSVEVYSDYSTSADSMISEAEEMFSWIPNAHIKIPITKEGLKAAEWAVRKGLRLNMTLCFNQEQAAAVYSATRGAKKGDVFISPFVGRLDDRGLNGIDLISNIVKMYGSGDGHVQVLSASIRNIEHFLCSLFLGADIVTVPFKILKEWALMGLPVPEQSYSYDTKGLAKIQYSEFDLLMDWQKYNITHELTDKGLESFARDWNSLIK